MTSPHDIPGHLSPPAVMLLRRRNERTGLIFEGTMPSTSELLDGLPFFKNSLERDISAFAGFYIRTGQAGGLEKALETLRDSQTIEAVRLVLDADDATPTLKLDRPRLLVYGACLGSSELADDLKKELAYLASATHHISYSNVARKAVAEGVSALMRSMPDAFRTGISKLRDVQRLVGEWDAADEWIDAGEPQNAKPKVEGKDAENEDDESIADLLAAVDEDRAEISAEDAGRLRVVPKLDKGFGFRKEIAASWTKYAGMHLPMIGRGNVAAHRDYLVGRWPHAAHIIDILLGDLSTSVAVRFRPTLLVGPPGCGKTSMLRAIAKTLRVPVETVSLAGVSDGALLGTSAQWNSARESTVLQIIKREGIANPVCIWDEVEKASSDRRNGSALDALLPLLERSQAKAYRDPALEVEVDLSMVSHLATANDIDLVPAPLRDRMRVLQMPEPTWQHLPDLVDSIVTDVMYERGLDVRWIPPFAEDELEVVRNAWPGGSVRQLQRIVETMIEGRETIWGRA